MRPYTFGHGFSPPWPPDLLRPGVALGVCWPIFPECSHYMLWTRLYEASLGRKRLLEEHVLSLLPSRDHGV